MFLDPWRPKPFRVAGLRRTFPEFVWTVERPVFGALEYDGLRRCDGEPWMRIILVRTTGGWYASIYTRPRPEEQVRLTDEYGLAYRDKPWTPDLAAVDALITKWAE